MLSIFASGFLLFIALNSSFLFAAESNQDKLPAEAQKVLDQIPNRTLSAPFVVKIAMKYSSAFSQVTALKPLSEIPYYSVQAALDNRFLFSTSYGNDQRTSIAPTSPTDYTKTQFGISYATFFSSGTSLSVDLGHNKSNFSFSGNPFGGYESLASLTLKQDLWKDFFGTSTRKALQSGKLSQQAAEFDFKNAVEDWSVSMAEIYYGAWLTQQRAFAASENLGRARALANIVRIRTRRGTSEKQNLIQIESKVALSQSLESSANHALNTQWKSLVIALGFPQSFLSLNPKLVPMSPASPLSQAQNICQETNLEKLSQLSEQSSKVKSAGFKKQVGDLKLSRAKLNFGPDIDFVMSYGTNQTSQTSRSDTVSNLFQFNNPAYSVGLTLSLPLEMSAEKSEYAAAISEQMSSNAKFAQAKDEFIVVWLSECSNLNRLQTVYETLNKTVLSQQERVSIEQRRFELGRTSLFDVIQAGDDATQFKIELQSTEAQMSISSWKVLKLASQLENYLSQN